MSHESEPIGQGVEAAAPKTVEAEVVDRFAEVTERLDAAAKSRDALDPVRHVSPVNVFSRIPTTVTELTSVGPDGPRVSAQFALLRRRYLTPTSRIGDIPIEIDALIDRPPRITLIATLPQGKAAKKK